MSSFWEHLFEIGHHSHHGHHHHHSDYRQRRELQEQRQEIEALRGSLQSDAESQASQFERLRDRLSRMELVFEALFELLHVRVGITREELALMIQRVDLADGFEDGRIGPDRSQEAPLCANCGRPANPRRSECAFCFEPLQIKAKEVEPSKPRTATCKRCQTTVPERTAYFTAEGLVCTSCFQQSQR